MKLLATAWTAACVILCGLCGLCILGGLGGCLWANEHSDSMYGYEARAMLGGDGHVEGAQAGAQIGFAGLYFGVEANLRDAVRPDVPTTHKAIGFGLTTRASLFGILGTTHELERHFDLGADAGAGGALVPGVPDHNLSGLGSYWVGAWVEVGTVDAWGGYLAVVGGIRREAFVAPWTDQTELAIGLAWRKREPLGKLNFHD
jgi:hypothetical protein